VKAPGQTKEGLVHTFEENDLILDQLLFDFDIDDDQVTKEKHQNALAGVASFMGRRHKLRKSNAPPGAKIWQVWLAGHASRTGNRDYNIGLSKRRMQKVKEYLTKRIQDVDSIEKLTLEADTDFNEHWTGFDNEFATVPGENPVARSVRVAVQSAFLSAPPPRTPPDTASTKFRIRTVSGEAHHSKVASWLADRVLRGPIWLQVIKYGIKAAARTAMVFEIEDVKAKKTGVYAFDGYGLDFGTGKTGASGFADFTARRTDKKSFGVHVELKDFAGPVAVDHWGPLKLTVIFRTNRNRLRKLIHIDPTTINLTLTHPAKIAWRANPSGEFHLIDVK
jgi:hypothetical protein